VKSIKEFPEMLSVRPIVIDENNMVLGGNMRLKACIEAGFDDVPVMYSTGWTQKQKEEFIIKDNVGFGEWDWDVIANEWEPEQLEEWGLDLPVFNSDSDLDYSEKNKEFDVNDFENQKYTIKLEFTEDDYNLVKNKLQQLGQSPEKILYNALVSL